MYYPWYSDKDFNSKIVSKKEIFMNRILDNNLSKRCIENYQYLVSNFLNPISPYKSLLLYFYPGVGKTLASISIAENFIRDNPLKQILVITKSKTLIRSFKSDLINICSSYVTDKEKELLQKSTAKKSITEIIEGKINKNYSFLTYDGFKKNTISFSNKIVIIDEVHNLLGNTGYDSIMNSIKKSKDYRLVLLSATPAYDNILPLFQLNNILNGKVNQLPTSIIDLQYKQYIYEVENNISTLYRNNVFSLTSAGKDVLLKGLTGKISYLKADTSSFPKVFFPDSINKIEKYNLAVNVIPCYMQGIQEEYYSEAIQNISFSSLDSTLQYMSSIIYPNVKNKKIFGKQGIDYYIKGKANTDFLLESNIQNYSIKLYNILKNLKKTKGKVYIHSENITNDGIPLINACLVKNGYKVLVISSTESDISNKIEKFNNPTNDDGSWKQIILGSKIIEEGVTFKSIRQVHIYEPSWNYSSLDQKLGRAIRRGSHQSLQPIDRTVDVFLYCSILRNNIEKSLDLAKYILSSIKDKQLKSFERSIAKNSFSCPLFKKRNVIKGIDGSRECDYTECEYTCDNEIIEPIDSSSFNMFLHNKEEYDSYVKILNDLFKKSREISIKDLITRYNFDKTSLFNILSHKPPFKIIKRGDILIKKKSFAKQKYGFIPKKQKGIKVSGYLDSSGGLIIKSPSKVNKEKFTEKNCTSYKKEELILFAKSLNINSSGKKQDICKELKKKLI